jgi:hypothetical protein
MMPWDLTSFILMTNHQEIETIIKEMTEFFGKLPNPEQEPIRFAYYVKLWKYYKGIL